MQAARAIRAYYGLKDDIEVDKQVTKCEEDGQKEEQKKSVGNTKKEPNGMEVMFMPWRANDPLSVVIRFGAWVGIMVKVSIRFKSVAQSGPFESLTSGCWGEALLTNFCGHPWYLLTRHFEQKSSAQLLPFLKYNFSNNTKFNMFAKEEHVPFCLA